MGLGCAAVDVVDVAVGWVVFLFRGQVVRNRVLLRKEQGRVRQMGRQKRRGREMEKEGRTVSKLNISKKLFPL